MIESDDRLDSEDELLLSRCRYCFFDRVDVSVRCLFRTKPCRLVAVGDGDRRMDDDIDRFRSLLFDGIVAVDDDIISIV